MVISRHKMPRHSVNKNSVISVRCDCVNRIQNNPLLYINFTLLVTSMQPSVLNKIVPPFLYKFTKLNLY